MSDEEPFTEATRRRLLELARGTIAAYLRKEAAPAAGEALPPGGAFVTLKTRASGHLRGCIGHIEADRPLQQAIQEMAIAAATEDPRFPAVTPEELDGLRLEISVLSPLERMAPADVEVGRHGLLVQFRGRRGLLLPQVAQSQGWDRETFLAHTCRKAGVPADSWRDPECVLLAFTATVFGEE